MSRSAERAKDPGPRSVGGNAGDSPARLATTAMVGAFPRWSVTTMATRKDAQLINAVSKLGPTHMVYKIFRYEAIRDRGTGASFICISSQRLFLPGGVYSLELVSAPGSVWSFLSLPQRAGLVPIINILGI